MDTARHTGFSYERALRVVGRHLDAEPNYHPSVVEDPSGFTVRSHPARHRGAERVQHFSWESVFHLTVLHSASRDHGKRRRHSGLWINCPTGHEDFFRALGYILDREGARDLSVDELPDGLSVCYLRPTGVEDERAALQQHHAFFTRTAIEETIAEAVGRRGQSVAAAG